MLRNHKRLLALMLSMVSAIFCINVAAASKASATATYQMIFVPTWNEVTFPHEYPTTPEDKRGHYSGLIGATHVAGFSFFKEGSKPTVGLEMLSEHGRPHPLDDELNAAKAKGKVGQVIQIKDPIKGVVHNPVMTTFTINQKFPLVSMVAMLAPSPDWFMGAANVRLFENGHWVPVVIAKAYAWDSGGDTGKTYLAADEDTNPKHKTTQAKTKFFKRNGRVMPVGVFVFKQVPSQQ